MKYEIQGGQLPVVICTLNDGEAMFTESGGMAWMSPSIQMSTNMEGGLFGGIARKMSGESMFLTNYKCLKNDSEIAFVSSMPGEIIALDLTENQSIICQKSAFLAGERSVSLEVYFKKNFAAGFFGGEGFILQKITGPGKVFVEIDGAVVKKYLNHGEVLKVDTGHLAMMDPTVKMDIVSVKGVKNVLFGGEGLFLTELTGPGNVYLQTMPLVNLAASLGSYIVSKK